ncbi:MAG: S8 family serine peptidase [Nostoc sp.]|uniref:S8 family serine peptidase n=1 Tax=Nostoc sp. TaxID=1180 RepID=UPI002FF9ABC0
MGETGEVEIDFLFDGGGYKGELAIFSLDGIDGFEPGSQEFIQEAAQRALSSSELGHVVIFDSTEGARFSANLNWEANFNSGEYQGIKTFSMRPGDEFGFMLVPNGRVEQVFNNPGVDGAVRPLFSLATANPNDAFHVGQIADVTGDGNTFALEDLRLDVRSDKDYNDIVFQVRGATGKAELLDDVINSGRDWRDTEIGKALVDYAEAYVMPDANDLDIIDDPSDGNLDINPEPVDFTGNEIADFDLTDVTVVEIPDATEEIEIVDSSVISQLEFPKADQPLVGIIDTGFSGDNPDIDYSRIILGQDRVDGDANPLLASGEGNEHGTHVLGVIAATQNNDVGIDGINDDAPVWVGRAIGSGKWADSLVEFVDAAKVSGQPNAVVNLSLDLTQVNPDGGVTTRYEFTPPERTAIEYARQNGVLIVVASGNDGGVMSALGQASQEFDNIITVGAADGLDRTDYSSYGDGLDILAAGGTNEKPIVSSTGDGVGAMAGTSVAAAKVTGAASQVWAANPQLSYRQVIEIIKSTATDLKTPGWDAETGAGLLNIAVAVSVAGKTTPEIYNPETFLIPTTWGGEGKVTPSERAVSVEFNGKYYDWDAYKIRSGDTLSGIALRTMGNGTASYYNFIAQRNGIANPNRIYAGQTIYVPRQVSAPTVNLNNTVNYQPAPPTTSTTINGYRVDGNFYPVYTNYRGTLGNPISGVINYSNGVTYQLFERGSIVSSQYGTYPIFGGIRQTYLNTGGLNGWLGAPKSAEIGQGNGVVIQYFANGYIIWNGSKATAYRNGSGIPSQPVPTPKPDNNIKLKNFRGWVMPGIGVALRNSPHLNDKSGKAEPYGKWLEFDAWTYGDTVKDYKVGTPDNRWFRVKGTNYWVPSAYIYGYPEGLPGNETPGSSNSGTNNNQPITSYADYLKRLYGGNGVITSYPSSAHNAIDSVNQGQYPYKVYALTSGVVKYIGKDKYGGNYVQIWNAELQRYFYYVHFAGFNPTLKVGQQIKAGDYIGNEGSTGNSTGRHTHVHVTLPDGKTKVDPLSALSKSSGSSGGNNDSTDNKPVFIGSNPTVPAVPGTTFGKQARVGFVTPYLSLWNSPNKTTRIDYLNFNDILYVTKQIPGGWYEITTVNGKVGYVDKNFIVIDPPEQGARLHHITSGQTAIGIAEKYYKNLVKPGEDLRFFVNALAYANQGMAGIYYEGKQWKDVDWKNIDWTKVKVRSDHDIWIPSGEFMQKLKQNVASGSITGGLWANTVNWVNTNVPDWAKFGSAFVGGLLNGATDSVLDIFRGLWDIGESIFNTIKSLVTGNILSDAKKLWDELSSANWSDLLSQAGQDFVQRWNDPDPWKSGHFRGWLLGYAIAEIAVIVMTAGAGAAATGVKVTGKLAKITNWLSKLPIVGKFIEKSAEAGKTLKWFEQSSVLRKASQTIGNDGLGAFTRKQADILGYAWVGRGYTVASDGITLVSANQLKQYRPPSFKPNTTKKWQANLEWRNKSDGKWLGDAHIDITDP